MRGHTRIGLIAGMRQSIHCSERLLGYQRALYENQILFNPKLLVYEDWTREKGYEAAEILLKENVSGIFAMNDEMAGGVYDYANEAAITIGTDIALVGFDNRPICTAFRPALTTMALPLHEMGYSSADRIVRRIEKREEYDEDTIYRIDCELKIRSSIGEN
jgi:LacI family transcriptional regulator